MEVNSVSRQDRSLQPSPRRFCARRLVCCILPTEPSHGRVAAKAPQVKNSLAPPKNDSEVIRSHNPTKLLRLSPKTKCTREITLLTGSSLHEELNRPGKF